MREPWAREAEVEKLQTPRVIGDEAQPGAVVIGRRLGRCMAIMQCQRALYWALAAFGGLLFW